MSRTLRFGYRTPISIDRHVARRRTHMGFDQLLALDDASRHIGLDAQQAAFGKRPTVPPVNTSFADAVLRQRRLDFLND